MLQVKQHGPVTVFRMGRHVGKTTLYPVHAFLLGETLIDSGANHVGREGLMRWVTGGHYTKQNTIDSILNNML
ncbi:MAG: hypothetical protein ACQEQ7_09065 [Thermodesulfobacteriota bacterium]